MPSLLGKAARALQAKTPVPMGSGTISYLPGQSTGGNTDLTLMRAYKSNGTVFANVSLLASAAAGPQWKLFRQQPQDGRRRYSTHDQGSDQRTEVVAHAALNCLSNPAGIQAGNIRLPAFTRFSLMELSGVYMETTGKSHWIVDRGPGDISPVPLGLWPVRPDRMTPVPSKDNWLAGWIYTSPDGQEKIPLRAIDVIWNRYPDPEDPYNGCGPIQAVLTDVEAVRYASEWNRNFFINSAEPGGVIQVDHELDDEEFNELVDRWRDTHRGTARSHRIAVLEAGSTWVPNTHTLQDMDFSNLRSSLADYIREALGMHKVMTGVTDDVNRANAQTGEEVFASWKVAPRLDRWRDVFNYQYLPLFGQAGTGVEFDYVYPTPQNREQDALELTAKSGAVLSLITAGYDPDDVLEVVGLPSMKAVVQASQTPALPPTWVPAAPPMPAAPAALPSGQPAGEKTGPDTADMNAVLQRQMAAWNRLAGVR
jgi:phage portal protein BeeE